MKRFSALLPFLVACSDPMNNGSTFHSSQARKYVPPVAPDDAGIPEPNDAGSPFSEACARSLEQTSCNALQYIQVSNACLAVPTATLCAAKHCGYGLGSVWLSATPSTPPNTIRCNDYICGPGRRPRELRDRTTRIPNDVGGWLAEAARMEAASVHAFGFLASDLESLGAPARLRRAAEQSARDEMRHADMMLREMKLHGGRYEPPNVDAHVERTVEAIAVENAVEGCVGESAAALIAAWQARHSRDASIRRAMTIIAEDEARHADLAWEIHAWILPRLDKAAQRRVQEAMRDASRRASCTPSLAPEDSEGLLGLPDEATAAVLVARLDEALWRAA